jgi:hypothetical protein
VTPNVCGGGTGSSALGDSCTDSSQCGANLHCVPIPGTNNGQSVCDLCVFPVTVYGDTCSGECQQATDCCELPLNLTLQNTSGKSIQIFQCEDILREILGGSAQVCGQQPDPASAQGVGCFYLDTYCQAAGGQCGSSNWQCTNNQCQFTGFCNNNGNEFQGCPTVSRTGAPLFSTCDTTANACQPGQGNGCTSDSQCGSGVAVVDTPGAVCEGTDCTCFDGGCYLKCATSLDCAEGFSCDETTKLCESNPGCVSNSDCVTLLDNVEAQCTAGVCVVPCLEDEDCSPSGAVPTLGKFNGTVCGSSHGQGAFCVPVGCDPTNASACQGTATQAATFCVAPETGDAGVLGNVVHSAITSDGQQ